MTGRPLNVPQGPGASRGGGSKVTRRSSPTQINHLVQRIRFSDILCPSVTMKTTPRPHVSEGQGGDGGRRLRRPGSPPSGGHTAAPQRTTPAEKDRKEKNALGTPGEDVSAAGEPGELSQSGEAWSGEEAGPGSHLHPGSWWAERLVWESDNPPRWLPWRWVNAGCELRWGGCPAETHVQFVNQRWCFQRGGVSSHPSSWGVGVLSLRL